MPIQIWLGTIIVPNQNYFAPLELNYFLIRIFSLSYVLFIIIDYNNFTNHLSIQLKSGKNGMIRIIHKNYPFQIPTNTSMGLKDLLFWNVYDPTRWFLPYRYMSSFECRLSAVLWNVLIILLIRNPTYTIFYSNTS